MDLTRRIETKVSQDSELWRIASTNHRQARRIHESLEDFHPSRQIQRRLPFEYRRIDEEEESATVEDQAEAIEQTVQNVQDLIETLFE
jgi:hypothetical protein